MEVETKEATVDEVNCEVNLVNLTQNTVRVYDETGERVLLELPTRPPAAEAEEDLVLEEELTVEGVPVEVVSHGFSAPRNVPAPERGTVYVVSYPVLQALDDERVDCVAPDTSRGSAVRDARGRIVGVRRFRCL